MLTKAEQALLTLLRANARASTAELARRRLITVSSPRSAAEGCSAPMAIGGVASVGVTSTSYFSKKGAILRAASCSVSLART